MKLLVTCVLFSTIMLVNAGVSRFEIDHSILGLFGENRHGSMITPEQKKCISDELKKLAIQYPEFKEWFADYEESFFSFMKNSAKCMRLQDQDERQECAMKAIKIYYLEWNQLNEQLPEEQRELIHEKTRLLKEHCMRNEE
ncbi:uncharacterized protein LOC116345142 [Contarinia nasturtii]|uniref:uncharacterized protein LOC116345142 n=1 Tax=Contarinia nasturtii TaxID=265458 RepID=UPI0012D466B2|nr:uncharacterized protein LOC116345142 [Contarinia nasturtii]